MYFALFLCGIYLGGAIVMASDVWVRDNGLDERALVGVFGWPAGLVVMATLGRQRAREVLGIHSPRELREDLDAVEEKLHGLQRGLDDMVDQEGDSLEELMFDYRQGVVSDILLCLVLYEEELKKTGGAADLSEARSRILDYVSFDAKKDGVG